MSFLVFCSKQHLKQLKRRDYKYAKQYKSITAKNIVPKFLLDATLYVCLYVCMYRCMYIHVCIT